MHELVVSFERLMAPEALYLATVESVTRTARCVGRAGEMHTLSLASMEEMAGAYRIEDGGRRACAGLRLRSSSAAVVSELCVTGSGAGRRIDFPQIVLTSEREHFGRHAWVDGWARGSSDLEGAVGVTIEGERAPRALQRQRTDGGG